MARSPEERLQDVRQAAIDLRDFIVDMETAPGSASELWALPYFGGSRITHGP
jgi:hypothetical protein